MSLPPVLTHYHNKKYEECNQLTKGEVEDIHEMVDMCDGILLQGGYDFYIYDVEVVKYTHSKDIPILEICLGLQTMGYAMNGEVGHVEHREVHKNKKDYSHSIHIDPKSKLYQILKKRNKSK